jgi:outer membrane autotransporter protein
MLSGGLFLKAMLDPFVQGRSGFGTATSYAAERKPVPAESAFAAVLKAPPKATVIDERWGVWGSAYGGYNRTDGDAATGSNDLTARAGGFTAGADYRYAPNSVLGVAVAIGETNWGLASGLGKGNTDVAQVGGYASTRWHDFYLSAAVAGAWYNAKTDRFVFVAGTDHLRADFDAHSIGARVEGGWRYGTPRFGVTPYAAVQVQSVSTPAYGEAAVTGANTFALNYAAETTTDTRTELGAWVDTRHALSNGVSVLLRGRAAWVHDFDPDRRIGALFQTLPGASFTVDGARAPEDAALISAAAELRLPNGVSFTAKFDGEFAGGSQTYAGTGTIRYAW